MLKSWLNACYLFYLFIYVVGVLSTDCKLMSTVHKYKNQFRIIQYMQHCSKLAATYIDHTYSVSCCAI